MATRLITGILMAIGVVLVLLYLPIEGLAILLTLLTFGCFLEYGKIAGLSPRSPSVVLAALFAPLAIFCLATSHFDVVLALFPLWFITLFLLAFADNREFASSIGDLQKLAFGMAYIALLLPLGALILSGERGLLFLLLGATHAGDTAAYFAGKAFGRRPFAPKISPKKTWEGFIGGLLGSAVAAGLCAILFTLPFSLPTAIGLGVLLGAAAALGDLAESMLKRSAQIKDSGSWIPGHGGILDRVDGLFFSGPALYLAMRILTSVHH